MTSRSMLGVAAIALGIGLAMTSAFAEDALIGTARLVFTHDAVTLDSVWYAPGAYKHALPYTMPKANYAVYGDDERVIESGEIDDPWSERHEGPSDSLGHLVTVVTHPDTVYRFVRFPAPSADMRLSVHAPSRDGKGFVNGTFTVRAPSKPHD